MTGGVSTGDLWWKNAVVYCVDIETFQDSDGDGIGDIAGLTQRIDYLAELGVTCLWLMPFFPTPDRDDGYDVTDLFGVDSRLGTHGDLVELLRTAADRGIRVVADLVVNHTSDKHPWFKAARRSRDNPFRDYYVWRSDPPEDTSKQVVFPDREDSIWSLDERTGEWYLHHFYSHQPDLNFANPEVRDQIAKSIGLWLQLGLAGFRVDAVPFLVADIDTTRDDVPGDPHEYLKALRSFLGRRRGDAILLGEVNLPHKDQRAYFGGSDGDELTMMFDFIGMQSLYLAMAREDARPLARALKARPKVHPDCQWATFVRNHDELTLDKLSERERQEVFAAFGPEPSMQLYGRGLKRRLPPMLDGDPRRLRMAYSLLFSLPGTPTLYYGEEIGMGEDLEAEGRMAVRTPMQWDSSPNGGFSTASPRRLVQRPVPGGYGPQHVNVADQRHDPQSLWSFLRELIQTYRECPELGWGEFAVLPQQHRQVLAHRCSWQGSSVIAVHNLSAQSVTATVQLDPADLAADGPTFLHDLFAHKRFEAGPAGAVELALDGYGHRWLRTSAPG
ncbi:MULTISPECIES: alpha-amylase family protein [Nocardioides]|uniref:Alpha-amylase n=1 Tax=Nocardioides vastitatis TaxID=2568655 RepID=A0ABW0ZCX6_9ACTN|nr:alpha-amylase family protein [Nocardioides sp.]THI96558.1 trehalose synthase [Nocardioides sp.]